MTDCERALLQMLEAGLTTNIAHIARMANVSDRHARRCMTQREYVLSELVQKMQVPGNPTRIIIKKGSNV